ncbi:hypothetical protein ebA3449 [Aromatoleum aromaticum EbN1]|uniref:Uncharacterized protein n=1 Tax=Aromatoleum aromaticum (strain DSM 19018 / LMG 30748 / EbN1) TaxID=76114 RepID=Q5P3P2_AROAE|nr:hypothetical protein ebA3449 [Aromatoleum aromaticum EbN1]
MLRCYLVSHLRTRHADHRCQDGIRKARRRDAGPHQASCRDSSSHHALGDAGGDPAVRRARGKARGIPAGDPGSLGGISGNRRIRSRGRGHRLARNLG